MNFSELKALSVEDIDLILKDQLDLYSPEEIVELKEYRAYLLEREQKRQEDEKMKRKRKNLVCPKCDGLNEAINTRCIYCDYQFKESDYYEKDDLTQDETEDSAESTYPSDRRPLYCLLFSAGGIGAIIHGCNLNNSVDAQCDSIWNNGSKDPGTVWIILGAVAVAIGLVLLFSALRNDE